MKSYEFDAVIQKHPKLDSTYIDFPYNVEKEFGTKGRVKVKVRFDKVEYRGSLARMGHPNHWIGLNKEVRNKVGKRAGEVIHVTVTKDTEDRIVEVPVELKLELENNPKAAKYYKSLSFTNQKEYANWISSAKRQETKITRITKAINLLEEGIKHP